MKFSNISFEELKAIGSRLEAANQSDVVSDAKALLAEVYDLIEKLETIDEMVCTTTIACGKCEYCVNLREAHTEIEVLKQDNATLKGEVERLNARVLDTQDWYQQRFNVLRKWVKEEVTPLSETVAHRYWGIVANGSPSPFESADWSETIHGQRIRAESAELKVAELTAERDEALKLAYIGEHRFPDLTWKARFDELHAEVESKVAQNVAFIGMYERLRQDVERLTAERDLARDKQEAWVEVALDAAFQRGVAAMREAAAHIFDVRAQTWRILRNHTQTLAQEEQAAEIRALPNPEDK